MTTLGAAIICSHSEPFIDLALSSALGIVDKCVIVGDPDLETRKKIFSTPWSDKIKLIWRDWDGKYGQARNCALKELDTDFCWMLDCDEVVGDNAFLIKEYIKNPDIDCYNIQYIHFVGNLNTIDATLPEHISVARIFKREGTNYPTDLHELPTNPNWKNIGMIKDVCVFHLGLCRGLQYILERDKLNRTHPQRSHSPEWCQMWKNNLLLGSYPVKQREIPLPIILQRLIE